MENVCCYFESVKCFNQNLLVFSLVSLNKSPLRNFLLRKMMFSIIIERISESCYIVQTLNFPFMCIIMQKCMFFCVYISSEGKGWAVILAYDSPLTKLK